MRPEHVELLRLALLEFMILGAYTLGLYIGKNSTRSRP